MAAGWMRTALRRIGIKVSFGGVICPELSRTVHIESDWRARIVTRRALVFTGTPVPGDLRDRFAIEPGSPLEILFYDSPDAVEVGRRRRDPHVLEIEWMPKQMPLRFGLYRHEDTWICPESQRKSAVSAQYRCDMKMGAFTIEFITPGLFEGGILLRHPGWRHVRSERALMKYALACLKEKRGEPARLDEGGKRAAWEVEGPRRGERYVFVLFHEHGIAEWERRVHDSSLVGRARRLVGSFAR